MIKQSYMMNFMPNAAGTRQAADSLIKTSNVDRNASQQFKSVLDSSINKTNPYKNAQKNIAKSRELNNDAYADNNQYRSNSIKPQSRTYRDVSMESNNLQKVRNKAQESFTDVTKEANNKKKNKIDAAVESMAMVFGIQPESFIKILQLSGVNPEELISGNDTQSLVNKLSDAMNLSAEQKNALMETINAVKSQLNSAGAIPEYSDSGVISAKTDEADMKNVASEKAGIEVYGDNTGAARKASMNPNLNEIMAGFKAKLNELLQKFQKDQDAFDNNVAESVKAALMKLQGNSAGPGAIDAGGLSSLSTQEIGAERADNTKNNRNQDSNGEGKDSRNVSEQAEAGEVQNSGRVYGQSGASGMQGAVDEQKDNGMQPISSITSQVKKADDFHEPVRTVNNHAGITKSEIADQVVQKAKVFLTGEKSEMIMDLKPDSLGKLALKVVTERGMVVAQFVAENQQVKEALEANMQLLKDSLEKQGLSVQGFSVSVRQDSYKGFGNERYHYTENTRGKIKADIVDGVSVGGDLNFEQQQRANPYAWSDSQINLTA